MNIRDFISGAFVGIVGDYVLYNVVGSFVKATPEWAVYGWGLFIAFNGAIIVWLKHSLTE